MTRDEAEYLLLRWKQWRSIAVETLRLLSPHDPERKWFRERIRDYDIQRRTLRRLYPDLHP